ncbi:MAG TPA: hypothetical protein DCW95_06875 [Chryseobacterium sp.]|nr:hypothetical protein [Chryseobacterium sp.]
MFLTLNNKYDVHQNFIFYTCYSRLFPRATACRRQI